jgi:multiple sugar transport system substrate-binding protein
MLSRRELIARAAASGISTGAILSALAACSDQPRRAQTTEGKAAEQDRQPGNVYSDAAADKLQKSLSWPSSAVPEPSSPVTITVAHTWDSAFWPRQQQFDKYFMRRHPTIQLRAENTPAGNYLQKYLTQAAGGTMPDVMYLQYASIQNFIQQGFLRPLDDYIAREPDFDRSDFTTPALGYYQRSGKLYGIAYDCGPVMLYYNKDQFEQAGVAEPSAAWTMDDLRDAAIKLTSGSGRDKRFGFNAIPYPNQVVTPIYLAPFGGRFLSEDETRCVLTEPASVRAIKWWLDLYLEHDAMPSPSDQQALQNDAFILGRSAMSANGSWLTPVLLEQADFDWAITDWPKGPEAHTTAAVGSCYAMTEGATNPDAAWIYLNDYLSTAGQTFMWASTGRGSPARKSAWKAYETSQFSAEGTERVPAALADYATSDGVLTRPTTPEVNNTVTPIWDRVVSRKLTVEQGCQEVVRALEPILAKNKAAR